MYDRRSSGPAPGRSADHDDARAPGRSTLTSKLAAPEDAVAAAGASSGAELPPGLRQRFEGSLGVDLAGVRVHTGDASAAAAGAVGARAYATGNDIHFGAGQYDPGSHAGQTLLAHEVAHTVQQGSSPRAQFKLELSTPHDPAEHEADRAADAMVAGTPATVSTGSGIQRKLYLAPGDGENGFSGPSYARKGPDGSTLSDRREATMGSAAYAAEYDNTCLDAAGKIVKGCQTLYKVAADLEKKASEGRLVGSDKDLMALAKQVKDVAKALQGMKQGWDKLKEKKFDFSKSNLAQEPELPKVLEVLKASKDSIVQAFDTSEKLEAFQQKPSRDTANAWATAVGKQFAAAKSIVSALPFPPGCDFMKQYFEGLLGAPAAYISAFQEIAQKRYDKLDEEMGGANNDTQLTEAGKVVWKGGGPMQSLVHWAFTAPRGHALYNWLKEHKTIMGVDLQQQPPFERAKGLVIMALAGDDAIAENRDAWVQWVRNFTPPN